MGRCRRFWHCPPWSVRLLNAQNELSQTKEERVAAFADHLKRMKELKQRSDAIADVDSAAVVIRSAGTWYVAEAERWLLRERAR